jgi:hypothetical protein
LVGSNISYNEGNVGIGTNDPTSILHVIGSSSDPAILAYNSGAGAGLRGESPNGHGVHGKSESSVGVSGVSTDGDGVSGGSLYGMGVRGQSYVNYGVYGESVNVSGKAGVFGINNDNDGYGVHGQSESGDGVYGHSNGSGKSGVYAVNTNPTGYAGYFNGKSYFSGNVGIGTNSPNEKLHVGGGNILIDNLYELRLKDTSGNYYSSLEMLNNDELWVCNKAGADIAFLTGENSGSGSVRFRIKDNGDVEVWGKLSKGSGSFKIDHPLDPENKYLQHSFVESPDMMNVYNGNVKLDENGQAVVRLPEYFEALNQDFRYQLTCIGGFAPVYIAEKITDNHFKIAGGKTGMEVSWQVTGVRQDPYAVANRIDVEEDKAPEERGYYLHPNAYGLPEEKGIETVRNPHPSQTQEVAKEEPSNESNNNYN